MMSGAGKHAHYLHASNILSQGATTPEHEVHVPLLRWHLVHILAALGYDWGLHLLLPLGADLELQVRPSPSSWLCLPMIDMALSTSLSAGRCLRNNTVVCSRLLSVHVSALGPVV